MQRTLASRKRVRLPRLESEHRTPVVQNKTRSRRNQARPKRAVVALNQGHHVAVFIDNAEIGGVLAHRIHGGTDFRR